MPSSDRLKALSTCPKCRSKNVSITPVPGSSLQFWCNECEAVWSDEDEPATIDLTEQTSSSQSSA